jgi:hypothetical protein
MDGESVSMSLQRLWREYGGPQGLGKALQTNLKVSISISHKSLDWNPRNSKRH